MAVSLKDAQIVAPPEGKLLALEVDLLLTGIAERYGYDFRHYARASITRRIRRAMQEAGAHSVSALQHRLLHDPDAAMRFVASISVHTTSMFRDPEVYRTLRSEVIPLLRTYPFVRIWHAGCSSGEEVYSLAILLEEHGLYDRCRIYATDISDVMLDGIALFGDQRIARRGEQFHGHGGRAAGLSHSLGNVLGFLGRAADKHARPGS